MIILPIHVVRKGNVCSTLGFKILEDLNKNETEAKTLYSP